MTTYRNASKWCNGYIKYSNANNQAFLKSHWIFPGNLNFIKFMCNICLPNHIHNMGTYDMCYWAYIITVVEKEMDLARHQVISTNHVDLTPVH